MAHGKGDYDRGVVGSRSPSTGVTTVGRQSCDDNIMGSWLGRARRHRLLSGEHLQANQRCGWGLRRTMIHRRQIANLHESPWS
jgi:hypothetical protein